jgi:hypothetical protein
MDPLQSVLVGTGTILSVPQKTAAGGALHSGFYDHKLETATGKTRWRVPYEGVY